MSDAQLTESEIQILRDLELELAPQAERVARRHLDPLLAPLNRDQRRSALLGLIRDGLSRGGASPPPGCGDEMPLNSLRLAAATLVFLEAFGIGDSGRDA